MDQKHNEVEVIDEQEFLETLVDQPNYEDQNQRQFVYTQQSGCFDIRSILINLLVYTLVLAVTSGWFSGFYLDGLLGAFEAAIVMSVLNVVLKPILVILTLPLTILTFGLFYVFVNGFLLLVADYIMGSAFEIHSFSTAVMAAVFISLLRLIINQYILKNSAVKMM